MAKKKAKPEERYEFVRAIVNADGELRWEWRLYGKPQGGQRHDEDVSDWSDAAIAKMTRQMLDLQPGEKVEVQRE